ncbi:hypothetical protein B0T18DRAFT_409896 [Schizothecium vesticola]|uniref:Uncharacterized protein n=1 Tax=Schizothecium vesticola TaxID=314040 RepID=A0AA40EUE1_9PEZI|nr:hypothetical protein B0T18DRAFT_409896 [Schizothecium vesticola]
MLAVTPKYKTLTSKVYTNPEEKLVQMTSLMLPPSGACGSKRALYRAPRRAGRASTLPACAPYYDARDYISLSSQRDGIPASRGERRQGM